MKSSQFLKSFLFLPIFLLSINSLLALSNNKVRIDKFKWMHVQTEHFDIYYDKSSEKAIPRVAHYLEGAWHDVGDRLNFYVEGRTPFFFYSNHNEFEQTNIVSIGEGTGGVTEAFKNRFLIFNNGSETWMKHVIYHEYGHVVQFNVLYGGFWKSIRLLKSPFYPLWVMEGMAEYVSGKVDSHVTDMVVRDAVYHNQLVPLPELQGFNHLKPNQVTLAYKTGNAAMNFLADEFGEEIIGKLLVKMESYFDISSALENLIGMDLFRLDFRFREWMDERYFDFFKEAKEPRDYGPQYTAGDGLPQFHNGLVVSPNGKKMYYFSDQNGPDTLFSYDFEANEAKALLTAKWSKFENIHSRKRSLSISPDGKILAFAAEKKQKDFLYLYDIKRKKLKKIKTPFVQIRSPHFSPDGENLVVVGMTHGFNDLYILNRKGKLIHRLTNSPQHETNPVYSNDGEKIIYSGEVIDEEEDSPAGLDLFEVRIDNKKITRITDYKGAEDSAIMLPDESLVMVRSHDEKGQFGFNLHHLPVGSTTTTKLTNLVGGAFTPHYNNATDALLYIAFNAGERHVCRFGEEGFVETILPTLPSPPKQKESKLTKKSSLFDGKSLDSVKPLPEPDSGDKLDFDWGDPPTPKKKKTLAKGAWPDTPESPLFTSPFRPYQFRGSTDLFLPFLFFSSQDGLVAANVWQFSDYLGNHQIQELLQYASKNDLFDLTLFYTYARFRPNFTFGMRSQRYFRDFNETELRRRIDGIGLVSYPLDRVNSIAAGVGANDEKDIFLDQSERDTNKRTRFWIASFTQDTVTGRYLVPTSGRRFNIFYQEGFDNFGGDQQFRTGGTQGVQYFKLPRESALATRLFYGRSLGDQPQEFRLGGVDRIRGVSRDTLANKKHNVVVGSAELRYRLSYLHARTRFLFPDFFFKAAYLILFDDYGIGWNNQQERNNLDFSQSPNTAGVGVSWPTFILQSFQLNLTVLWATRTDENNDVWYITLGPFF